MRKPRNPFTMPDRQRRSSKMVKLGTVVALILALGVALLRNTPVCRQAKTSPSFPTRQSTTQPALPHPLRIAFYNIEFFNEQVNPQRLARLKAIVSKIDADIWGLAEISNRAALEKLFDSKDYQIMIQDSPKGGQEVALAVHRPLRFLDPAAYMVFSGHQSDAAFPGDRKLLHGTVILPGAKAVQCFVVHAKSRAGGRFKSEERRREHARQIVQYLKSNFNLDETPLVLLGDFNDTPDDASLKILETGNPNAPPGMENNPDPFLTDLGEPLWARNMATFGLTPKDIGPDGRIGLQRPGVRKFNMEVLSRASEPKTIKPALFDNILVSAWLAKRIRPAGMYIYDQANAVEYDPVKGEERTSSGTGSPRGIATWASDHLPVYADFKVN